MKRYVKFLLTASLATVIGCQDREESVRVRPEAAPLEPVICTAPATRADLLWQAITIKESGGDRYAYNEKEGAVGIAQIREIYVRDANRILRDERYNLTDRLDATKSYEMFRIVTQHYSAGGSDEEAARIHNGGPRGMFKESTIAYWEDVKVILRLLQETQGESNE